MECKRFHLHYQWRFELETFLTTGEYLMWNLSERCSTCLQKKQRLTKKSKIRKSQSWSKIKKNWKRKKVFFLGKRVKMGRVGSRYGSGRRLGQFGSGSDRWTGAGWGDRVGRVASDDCRGVLEQDWSRAGFARAKLVAISFVRVVVRDAPRRSGRCRGSLAGVRAGNSSSTWRAVFDFGVFLGFRPNNSGFSRTNVQLTEQ